MAQANQNRFGIYFHWPFCAAKCPYCDFNSHVWSGIDHDVWCSAFLEEIRRVSVKTGDRIVTTVFFGGGTPSLMDPSTVEKILNDVRRLWRCANDLEVTLEANPTSVEAEAFRDLRLAGVNRVSLGMQALNDRDLRRLGRQHSVHEGLAALETAMSQFDRVSFDLIYARQDQSQEDWLRELQEAVALGASHMSLYQLTVEPGTAFHDRLAIGGLKGLPDDDRSADLFEITQSVMESANLPPYETSNHARSGEECRHNILYWTGVDYAGIGPGAHGRLTLGKDRFATECTRDPATWLKDAALGSGESKRDRLGQDEQIVEAFVMGLRLREGIASDWLESLGLSQKIYNNINNLKEEGLLVQDEKSLRLTDAGWPLADFVVRRILT